MLMNGGETATGVNGYSQGCTNVKEEGTEMHGESSTSNQGKVVSFYSSNTAVWLTGKSWRYKRLTKLLDIDRGEYRNGRDRPHRLRLGI